jgi:hypothetical protein
VNPSTTPTTQPDDAGDRSLKGLAKALREAAGDGPVLVRENWRLGVAGLAVLAVLAVIVWLAWLLIAGFVRGLHSGGDTISGWLQHAAVVHAVNDPVRSWMDTHTAGLPVTGHDLWLVWLTALTTIWPAALFGSTYARTAWALLGAMTGAAAYAGAPHGTGVTAAALTAVLWLLLSLPVYSRFMSGSAFEQLARDRDRRRAARNRPSTRTSSKEY